MFTSRGPRRGHRFINWQLGLFFLAAAIWLAGLLAGFRQLTVVSIALLLVAMGLGVLGRRRDGLEEE